MIVRDEIVSMASFDTAVRDGLNVEFRSKFAERFDYERLSTFVANKKTPIHRWFSFTQGFSYRLVEKLLNELSIHNHNNVLDPF